LSLEIELLKITLGFRMKSEQAIVIGVAGIVVAIAAYFIATKHDTEITPEMLNIGLNRPIIWVYYDDSQVNSRYWSDFGARSSRVINIPILNLCYESIVKANGEDYRIEVIGGLQGVSELLGDVMPKGLNPRANVGPAQLDWIRTAILAKFGGLWLSNSVVCVKGFGKLPENVIAFGQDDVPMYGSSVPGFRALWSPRAGEPRFVEWEKICRDRIESQVGPQSHKSDWAELFQGAEIRRDYEFSRDARTQKKLQLEDLFATQGGSLSVPCDAKYIVIPYDDLVTRTMFAWILRSSEEQILASDMAISKIFRKLN